MGMRKPLHLVKFKKFQKFGFGSTPQVVDPNFKYYYDAIYRLTKAKGRAHSGQGEHDETDYPVNDLPHPNQSGAVENYTKEYQYQYAFDFLKYL